MLVLILSSSGILHAQFESFVLKDKYSGIESRKGKNYCEIEVFDSTLNIDSYVSTIYSTLAESYPHADIQVIGKLQVLVFGTLQIRVLTVLLISLS